MTNSKISEVKTTHREPDQERRIFNFKITQFVWVALGILETMIALRILLKLIAANPDSSIVSFIYGFTNLFLFPFEGMTATPAANGMVLEISSFFAMAIYALIGWAVERIIWLIVYRPRGNSVSVTRTSSCEDQTP